MRDRASPPHAASGIRPARAGDVDALVELAAVTFRQAHVPFLDPDDIDDYVARTFTPAAITSILDDASSTLCVLERDDRLLGYLHLRSSTTPACVKAISAMELVRIYLRREAIGHGHGAALMRTAISQAQRLGCDTLWLLVCEPNEHARGFYRRWGFVDVGSAPFRFGGRDCLDPVMAVRI